MGRPSGRTVSVEFANSADTVYTARVGLVPIYNVAKELKIPQAINEVCSELRHSSYTEYDASQICMLLGMGMLGGLQRVHHILTSPELPLLARMVNLESIPAATTMGRFFERFEDKSISKFQALNFDLGSKGRLLVDGFRILAHDQSALQKYGTKMEGVEKGYGGTLKKGSLMLQSSLITDTGMHSILHLDIKPGSTHSFNGATAEMDLVLGKTPEEKGVKRLVLADSAYGAGDYMRMCDKNGAHFILGLKNDSWMKSELETLDFQRFKYGKLNPQYGYREFLADRDAWLGDSKSAPLFDSDWDGSRRVVVVKLPREKGEPEKFLFLGTTLSSEEFSAEDVHSLYRKNRESIEQINDEIQNQLGLCELPSHALDANRGIAQVIALAWNLQRHVEHVAMAKARTEEAARRAKTNTPENRKIQRRFEWWTLFVRFITIGGRIKTGRNKISVITGQNAAFMEWVEALKIFDWKPYQVA